MRIPVSRCARSAAVVLLAVSAATGCGGDDPPATAPAGAPSASAAAPSSEPSPDPRSPEALAELLVFTAPPETDPMVQEALLAYADTLRQFVIASGLGQADYPPLLARINLNDVELKDLLLSGLEQNVAAGEISLGTFTERVTDAALGPRRVLIDTCTDYRERVVHSMASGMYLRDVESPFPVVRTRVIMSPSVSGWVVSQFSVPDEQNCA